MRSGDSNLEIYWRCQLAMTEKKLASDDVRYKQEATITKKVKAYLETQPDIVFYKASDRYHKGISDIIACVRGRFVAIELKKEGGVTSPHQALFIKQVERSGGIGGVCETVAEVKALVDKARNEE